jgi:PKD repeat protein
MAQSRIGSAPAGTMNTPITLSASSAIDSDFSCPSQPFGTAHGTISCRWGDYAGASVDPTNGNIVWGSSQVNGPIGELVGGLGHKAQWATQNFALTANDLAPSASFTISRNPSSAGSLVGFNGGLSSDPDGTIAGYGWSFGDGSPAASGAATSHSYAAAGTYTVTLTVTDNGGQTATATQSVTVVAKSEGAGGLGARAGGGSSAGVASVLTNDNFSSIGATVNQKTGMITFTEFVENPGTLSWLLTFANGKFGAFAAKAPKCKAGFIKLNGKCRPAKIVFGKGRGTASAAGTRIFTVKPSTSALKALKNALKRKKGLPVTATLTFQSSLGGSPVSHTQTLIVKLKK